METNPDEASMITTAEGDCQTGQNDARGCLAIKPGRENRERDVVMTTIDRRAAKPSRRANKCDNRPGLISHICNSINLYQCNLNVHPSRDKYCM